MIKLEPFDAGMPSGLERILRQATGLPGYFGRSAARKLMRRELLRTSPGVLADFDRLVATLGPQDVVLDLGANVGVFSAEMAKTGAIVHAYEPDPYAFSELTKRFASVKNVHLHNKAVAARAGELTLTRPLEFASDPARYSVGSSVYFVNSDPQGIKVEVVAFSDALELCGKPVSIVKMDIEGAEFDILEQVFADPDAFDFAAMFVETHQRSAPAKRELIDRLRREAETLTSRYINLYWP